MYNKRTPALLAALALIALLVPCWALAQEIQQTFVDWACNVIIERDGTAYNPKDMLYPRYLKAGDVLKIPPDQTRCTLGMGKVLPGMMLDVYGFGKVMISLPVNVEAQIEVASDAGRLRLKPSNKVTIWTNGDKDVALVDLEAALVECKGTVKVERKDEGAEVWCVDGSAVVKSAQGETLASLGFGQSVLIPKEGPIGQVGYIPLGGRPPMEITR